MSIEHLPEVWIGFVEIRPLPNSKILLNSTGAFVYVLTVATDPDVFQDRARESMDRLQVQIIGMEAVETIQAKRARTGLSEDIEAIGNDVAGNPKFIRHSTFHTWKERPT